MTYLDLITLLLVLLVVMLALSGQAAKLAPEPATSGSGLLPAHSGLLPGGTAPDSVQVVPQPKAPIPPIPAIVAVPPAPAMPSMSAAADPLPAIIASTEWDQPAYAPGLIDTETWEAPLRVDLPAHFQAQADDDALLRHVMGNGQSAPAPIAAIPAVPSPVASGMNVLALPELGDDIEIIRKQESISFRINSEILYGSAKADLSLEGLAVLRKLVPVLKESQYTITVEGHTDALPIRGGQYPSNWELSSARAGRVVRYLAANGVGRTRLRAIGYADTRPLVGNDTEQGRANNRRVEIILE